MELIENLKQTKDIKIDIGNLANTGLEFGLRAVLPDFIEDDIIDIKDKFIQEGFTEGVKETYEKVKDIGKSIQGIFTGKFESVEQVKRLIQTDGILDGTSEIIEKTAKELDEFFAGKRRVFDIPLLFVGTDFQKAVWNELLKIPYGKTISYGEMAQRLGMPKAVRAVANANGANAISILAPCHRVIGSDHSLTGYGGGLAAKRMLLEIEGIL